MRDRVDDAPAAARRFPAVGWVGLALVGFFVAMAVLAPWVRPYRPEALSGPSLASPDWDHLLGTNRIGQDLASQLIVGSRASLLMGLMAGLGTVAIGALVGVTAGWLGGVADAVAMRVVDVAIALPRLPMLILLGVYVGDDLATIAAVIAVLFWPGTARVVRGQVLSLRRRAHVRAAVGFGARAPHILRRHVAPEVGLVLVASLIASAGRAVLLEAGLAFLGLGDPARTSWGSMIREARQLTGIFYTDLWLWWLLPPVLAISLVLLGMTFVGVAVEQRLNPRLTRHLGIR